MNKDEKNMAKRDKMFATYLADKGLISKDYSQ